MNPVLIELGQRHPDLLPVRSEIEAGLVALRDTFTDGGKLLVCGNGGSAADADHIVAELAKGLRHRRPLERGLRDMLVGEHGAAGSRLAELLQGGLPAISLGAHTALLTAVANDMAPEVIFAQQVHVYGKSGDALLALSTSGRSLNVLHAVRVARTTGLRTIGLTGADGGELAALCDVTVRVPALDTLRIQELHLPIYHAWCTALEVEFFGPAD